jgi:hypothetical protein
MEARRPKRPVRQKNRIVDSAPLGNVQTDFVMERFGPIEKAGRAFDIEYWQRQGDAAIYRAAWELVEFYHRQQGMEPDELRLQRSIETLKRP